ncbi:MAG: hypothetical protein IRY90_06750 [Actinomadura rubrobrunea]|nr:hypothetical protein [Actinomadura rubrobrunea]
MGFADLLRDRRRLRAALRDDDPPTPRVGPRAARHGDRFHRHPTGAGVERRTAAGRADEAAVATLRCVRRKLIKVAGRRDGARPRG